MNITNLQQILQAQRRNIRFIALNFDYFEVLTPCNLLIKMYTLHRCSLHCNSVIFLTAQTILHGFAGDLLQTCWMTVCVHLQEASKSAARL